TSTASAPSSSARRIPSRLFSGAWRGNVRWAMTSGTRSERIVAIGHRTKERPMPTAVIVDAVRTPLGRRNGKLKDVHPVDLAAHTLRAIVERTGIDPAIVEDVIMGCVMQVGSQGVNIGGKAARGAGFPESRVGTTIDRQCGSSQQAAHFAAQGVMAGAYDVVIAAGVENMSAVPMGASIADGKYGFPFGPEMTQRY